MFPGRRSPHGAVQLYPAATTHRCVGLRRVRSDEDRFCPPGNGNSKLVEKIRVRAGGGSFLLWRRCQQHEARGLSSSSRRFQKQEAVLGHRPNQKLKARYEVTIDQSILHYDLTTEGRQGCFSIEGFSELQ